jgi:hypothetical protein
MRRPKSERICDELERRIQWHKARGKPVPHALAERLSIARLAALSAGMEKA